MLIKQLSASVSGIVKQSMRRLLGASLTARGYAAGAQNEYDYVIVGGGSAGCVLAHRLSSANNRVCLLEAGPSDDTWMIRIPSCFQLAYNSKKYNWHYKTTPQPAMDNIQVDWPRGKTLGGSSSINAMMFNRGNPMDFDRWASEQNAPGWSYADVLPYFKRMESYVPADDNPKEDLERYRGFNGPLRVTSCKLQNQKNSRMPIYSTLIEAVKQAGHGYTHDINGYKQEGAGWYDCTIHNGERMNTSVTYLNLALQSKRVQVRTNTHATKLVYNSNKSKVVGVEVAHSKTRKVTDTVYASKDVIVSSGAVNSPQLLMLSGIGDSEWLKQHGISTVVNLRGVGRNLQDHLAPVLRYASKVRSATLYDTQLHISPMKAIRIARDWFTKRQGLACSNAMESGGFIRVGDSKQANIQLIFVAAVVYDTSEFIQKTPGMQMHIYNTRPFSRGTLRLQSTDPFDAPLMDPGCYEDKRDMVEMISTVRAVRAIFRQPAFDALRGDELTPSTHAESDEQISKFIKVTTKSGYHPCSSCKMGDVKKDPLAVVDPLTMRVHGIDGLRVVDASVMPSETSGNLNAPTIMIAERASDLIMGKKVLEPLNVPYWKA